MCCFLLFFADVADLNRYFVKRRRRNPKCQAVALANPIGADPISILLNCCMLRHAHYHCARLGLVFFFFGHVHTLSDLFFCSLIAKLDFEIFASAWNPCVSAWFQNQQPMRIDAVWFLIQVSRFRSVLRMLA